MSNVRTLGTTSVRVTGNPPVKIIVVPGPPGPRGPSGDGSAEQLREELDAIENLKLLYENGLV